MMLNSVRGRLTAWYTAVLAATLLMLSLGAYWGLRTSIRDTVDGELLARLSGMREFVENQARHADGETLAEELREQAGINPAGAPLRIADSAGHWLYQTDVTRAWGPFDPAPGFRTLRAGGEVYRVLTATALPGTIQLGAPLGAFDKVLETFTWTAILASPILLLLAGAGGYLLSGRALAPVDAITTAARNIGANDLGLRLPLSNSGSGDKGDELDRLSETLNAMFARLEDAFRRITHFTADASHELRTPVAVIRTTAELARSRPRASAEYERALDSILAESERTSSLIDDLLLLARTDAPGSGLEFEKLDLADEVRDACGEAEVLATARGINLLLEPAASLEIQADPQALHRLLLALLDNAVKYTPPGGHVRVSIQRTPGGCQVCIKDTGIGIASHDLPHIFERFYRASKDRRREGGSGGTGLGLSLAQWIAERHGGRITATSQPGTGSTFLVDLPLDSGLLQNPGA